MSDVDCLDLLVQVAGVIVLTVYTYLTYRQVRALVKSNATSQDALIEVRRSNDTARETMILGHRSWINVRIEGVFVAAETVTVEIANVGAVPAGNVSIEYAFKAVDAKTWKAPKSIKQETILSLGSLGVQDKYSFTPDAEDEMRQYLTPSGFDMKGLVFHFACRVSYENGFEQLCSTECSWYHLGGTSWARIDYSAT